MTRIYTARWVLPMNSAPINDGAIAVANTRIVAVGEQAIITSAFPDAVRQDFGESVILPGFTNAHTHLELTVMRGFLDDVEHDFFKWLRKLTVARRDFLTKEDLYVSAAWGAVEAVRAGVTCVGDASDAGETSWHAMRDVGLRGIVYQELFGIDETNALEQLAKLKDKVAALRELKTTSNHLAEISNFKSEISNSPLVRTGISPHAPYTVSGKLIELAAAYAIDENLPVMIHAAESQAESAFMREGTGAFAEGLNARGIEWHAPKTSTIKYLAAHGLLDAKPLLAHGVTIDEHDLDLIKHHGASIAHCPKSNLKLGHGRAPFAQMLKHKIPVGLGSDSVASNNTNDMLEEARFALLLARLKREDAHGANFDIEATDVLKIITRGGAQALRIDDETGTLEAGKQADFAVIKLSEPYQQPVYNVASALVNSSSGRDVIATVIAGREVFINGKVTGVDEDDLRGRVMELASRLINVSSR